MAVNQLKVKYQDRSRSWYFDKCNLALNYGYEYRVIGGTPDLTTRYIV